MLVPMPQHVRKLGGFLMAFPWVAKFLIANGVTWGPLLWTANHSSFLTAIGLTIIAYTLVSQFWILMLILTLTYILLEVANLGGG